jgi:hypothetical protein
MSLLLIDDEGEIWRGDSRQLRISFDSPYSGGEFCEYAVKNLGFVAINMYGASCQLRLRPKFVGEKTYKALTDWLSRGRLQRVVLSVFDKQWRDELVQAKSARARIEQLLEPEDGAELRPGKHLSRPLPVGTAAMSPELRNLIATWSDIASTYEPKLLVTLVRRVLRERFVVIKVEETKGSLVFGEISSDIYRGYDTWRSCAVGAPLEEQPDREFGRWVSNAYSEALQSSKPRFDAVDVIMRLPASGRSRLRYRRLIFPVPSTSTSKLLIGGSIIDPSIDLRVTAH